MFGLDGTAEGGTTAAIVAIPTWVQNITVNKRLMITAMITIPTWLFIGNSPLCLPCELAGKHLAHERFLNDCPKNTVMQIT
jgi:hypothetical protein